MTEDPTTNTSTSTTNTNEIVYFNNAGQAPLESSVQRIGCDQIMAHPGVAHAAAQTAQSEIRYLFARLIQVVAASPAPLAAAATVDGNSTVENVDAETRQRRRLNGLSPSATIAMMTSTAFAVTLAARNLQRLAAQQQQQQQQNTNQQQRYRVLVLQDQFDSAIYPWQQICDESNGLITLDIVPHPTEYDGWTRAILERLSSSSSCSSFTAEGQEETIPILAACLPPLHWSDGSLIDLKVVGNVCRKQRVPLIVDATQAAGILPLSVSKIRPTMLVCSAHKWLRGPSGTCLVYMDPAVYESWMPLDWHGRGRDFAGGDGWDASKNEMGPNGYPAKFWDDARKFDAGGKANAILLPMLAASLRTVVEMDLKAVQLRLKTLLEPLLAWAKENGYIAGPGPRAHHIVGLIPLQKTPQEMLRMAQKLQEQHGVVVAVRCGGFRISPYLDNTPQDVQTLIHGLEQVGDHPFSHVTDTTRL